MLKKGDIKMVSSDGISDVMHDEEYPIIVETLDHDIPAARDEILEQASMRKCRSKEYPAIHNSELKIQGKPDDRTIILEEHGGNSK